MSVFIGKTVDNKQLLHITSKEYGVDELKAGAKTSSIFHSGLQSLIVTDTVALNAAVYGTMPNRVYMFTIPDNIVDKMRSHVYNITFTYSYQLSATSSSPYNIWKKLSQVAPMQQLVSTLGNQAMFDDKKDMYYTAGMCYAFNSVFTTTTGSSTSFSTVPDKYLAVSSTWGGWSSDLIGGINFELYGLTYTSMPTMSCVIDILNIDINSGFVFPTVADTISISKNAVIVGGIDVFSTKVCVPSDKINASSEVGYTSAGGVFTLYSSAEGAIQANGMPVYSALVGTSGFQLCASLNSTRLLGGVTNRVFTIGGNGRCSAFKNMNTGIIEYYNAFIGYAASPSPVVDATRIDNYVLKDVTVVEILNTDNASVVSTGLNLQAKTLYKETSLGKLYFSNPTINTTSMLVSYPNIINLVIPVYTTESGVSDGQGNYVWNYNTLLSTVSIGAFEFDTLSTVTAIVLLFDTQGVLKSQQTRAFSTSITNVGGIRTNGVVSGVSLKFVGNSVEIYRSVIGEWYHLAEDPPVTIPYNLSGYTLKLILI